MFVDAGPQNDRYALDRTSAMGRADIGSWSVFAELGGDDAYASKSYGGRASRIGIATFFDADGTDNYDGIRNRGAAEPADGRLFADPKGGLFLDR